MGSREFGTTTGGEEATLYLLENANGLRAHVTDYGATLVRMVVPGRDGQPADVVLGFDDVSGYQSDANQYFGCTTGRFANRIRDGRFRILNREYTLAVNNEPNHLHGGLRGFDKVMWEAEPVADKQAVRFSYRSLDGEEGYPGNLSVVVTYELTDADELIVDYWAVCDEPTHVNLTNHAYWNLAGAGNGTILDHELTLPSELYLPTDDTLIPTGEFAPVIETPLDFRTPRTIGERIAELEETAAIGYDHCYVVRASEGDLAHAATLHDPGSGRTMEVWTSEPGIQLYSGNWLEGKPGKGGLAYPRNAALCLETQHFPDTPNQPRFPSTLIQPGDTYRHTTAHRFSTR